MKFKKTITAFLSRIIYRLLSVRVKRMIFWGSVIGYFKGNHVAVETLKEANNKLKLCKDSKALALPVSINSVMWWDNNVIDTIEQCLINYNYVSKEKFLNEIPSWLRYAEKESMSKDLDKFVLLNVFPT